MIWGYFTIGSMSYCIRSSMSKIHQYALSSASPHPIDAIFGQCRVLKLQAVWWKAMKWTVKIKANQWITTITYNQMVATYDGPILGRCLTYKLIYQVGLIMPRVFDDKDSRGHLSRSCRLQVGAVFPNRNLPNKSLHTW